MIHKIYLIPILLLLAMAGVAQTYTIGFQYDDAGNRIKRTVNLIPPPGVAAPKSFLSDEVIDTESLDTIQPETLAVDDYSIRVYPNPTMGEMAIQITPYKNQKGKIQVTTINGIQLLRQTIESEYSLIDISNYTNGDYVLIVTVDKKPYTWTIIKK